MASKVLCKHRRAGWELTNNVALGMEEVVFSLVMLDAIQLQTASGTNSLVTRRKTVQYW